MVRGHTEGMTPPPFFFEVEKKGRGNTSWGSLDEFEWAMEELRFEVRPLNLVWIIARAYQKNKAR